MDVLVTEATSDEAGGVATALTERGHRVFQCTLDASELPLCMRFSEGGDCPLDETVIAVAVDVRSRNQERLTPREYGAVCALQRRVPVVFAGEPRGSAVATWAEQVCDIDAAVDTAESVAHTPTQIRCRVVRHAVQRTWAAQGLPGPVNVDVVDDGVAPEVIVTVSEFPDLRADQAVTAAARGALRPYSRESARAVVTYCLRPEHPPVLEPD